jgi:tRNA nucleotidyltransferase (CCA-adding enzyme)
VIAADAPIDDLRDLIVSSGWGQIPVVDPQSGKLVGIATRTDLIKIMTPTQATQRHTNLADKLEHALPPVRLALLKAVVAMAEEKHMAVYIVGGFVRDLLLDRPGIDFDLVVEGDALSLGRSLARKFGGRTVTHARFGTAKWFILKIKSELAASLGQGEAAAAAHLPDSLDLISARTEFYDYPTALPTVESSGIKLDLHRRDFTINTLALRLDGRHYGDLHDDWGGLKDLRKGIIRVLHSLSFIDDPTRLLRAARFEQRFDFKIEKRTLELMSNAFEVMKHVSGDRLRHEFDLILQEPKAGAILKRLSQLGVLATIHPAFDSLDLVDTDLPVELDDRLKNDWSLPLEAAGMPVQLALNWLVWLGRIQNVHVEKVSARLRLPSALKAALVETIDILGRQEELKGATAGNLVTSLDRRPLLSILASRIISRDEQVKKQLDSFALKLRHIQPGIDGSDLTRMGLKPSPRYRTILAGLRSAWLDGTISSSSEEQALVKKMIEETGNENGTGSRSRK